MRSPISRVRSVTRNASSAYKSERGQQQATERERAGHERAEPLLREAFRKRLFERANLRDGHVRIEPPNDADGCPGGCGRAIRSDEQCHAGIGQLPMAVIDRRPRFALSPIAR